MELAPFETPPPGTQVRDGVESSSDEQLIESLVSGDRALAGELHRRLLRSIDATLCRVLGRGDVEYDDLVQSALEQIVISLVRGKFSRGSTLATWASGVTSNVALRAIRRRKLERRLFDRSAEVEAPGLSPTSPSSPEAQVIARRHLERFRRHLSRMSRKLSETLILHDVLGFGLKETASMTGTTLAAVRSRLVRGRRDLGQRLRRDVELPSTSARGV